MFELIRDLFRWTFRRIMDAVAERKQIKETYLDKLERLQTGDDLMLPAGDTSKLGEFAGSKYRETEHRIKSVREVQYPYFYSVPESAHDEIRQLTRSTVNRIRIRNGISYFLLLTFIAGLAGYTSFPYWYCRTGTTAGAVERGGCISRRRSHSGIWIKVAEC